MASLSVTVTSLLRKASILSLSLLLYGLGLSVGTVEAQPNGGLGWCTGQCEGSMNVSGPFGACPGNLVTCPVSGQGCMLGQSGSCCAQSSAQEPGMYSYNCESSGGGGGGGGDWSGECRITPFRLSASCNPAGTQAIIDFGTASGWSSLYDLRVDADPTSWTNTCARVNPGDVCTTVRTPNYILDTIPGHTYNIWVHPYLRCDAGLSVVAEDKFTQSGTLTCAPPPPPAPTVSLSVSQTTNPGNTAGNGGSITIPSNQTATLSWRSTNAASCTASGNWAGAKGVINGQVYAEATGALAGGAVYTYNLRCTNSAGDFRENSVRVAVNLPPLGVPAITHVCNPGNTVTLNYGVPTATSYYLRIDETEPSWVPCVAPDQCLDNYPIPSYTRAITPGVRYGSWVHALRASDGDRKDSAYYAFQCDAPQVTVRGRITNQAGVGIPGVTIPACASNPGAVTDASGNYSFTVSHDARFCIRPNTPAGMNSNPLLSGLQPSQQAIHTYEWQVAGWNAGVHPFCDNFDSVNRIPASCDEWKQWDRSVDTGYDFAYSPIPLATVDLKANNADNPTVQNNQPVTLTWSTSNVVPGSCSASGAWNGGKVDNNATGENRGNLATGVHTFTLTCRENISNILRSDTVSVTSIVPPCVCNNDTGVCKGEYYTGSGSSCVPNGCGPGTKDCRRFWKEVAP